MQNHEKESQVYMLLSLNDMGFYVGITGNVIERLAKHNRGEAKSTKSRRPFRIVYNKDYESYGEARKHEKWLKKKDKSYKIAAVQFAPPILAG